MIKSFGRRGAYWLTILLIGGMGAWAQAEPLINDDSLVAYYGMEDNAGDPCVLDGSGNGLHGFLDDATGTETTAAHSVTGVMDGLALAFDGKDDVITISRSIPDYMSVAMWIKPNHNYVTGRGDKAYPPAANDEWDFFSAGNNRDAFRVHHDINFQGKFNCRLEADEGGWFTVSSSTGEPQEGQWYHLCATFDDGTDLKIYVNGVQEDALTVGPGKTVQDGWSGMSIGGGWNGSSAYYCAPAAIDEVYIFNRALTVEEVTTLVGTELVWDCDRIQGAGLGIPEDLNSDCYVQQDDYAVIAGDWDRCSDPNDPACSSVTVMEFPDYPDYPSGDIDLIPAGEHSLPLPRHSIAVDGDLSEWYGEQQLWFRARYWDDYAIPGAVGVDPLQDVPEVLMAMCWDTVDEEAGISKAYAAVIVPDTFHYFMDVPTAWYDVDALSVYCQGDNDVGVPGNDVRYSNTICEIAQLYAVSPDAGATPADWGGDAGATLGGAGPVGSFNTGFEYACVVDGDTITYEVGAVLYDNLGEVGGSVNPTAYTDAEVGDLIRFDLTAYSRYQTPPDPGGGLYNIGGWLTTKSTGKWRSPITMIEWELVDDHSGLCGDWGYYIGDVNVDCYVDLDDLSQLAARWLFCYDGTDTECTFSPY